MISVFANILSIGQKADTSNFYFLQYVANNPLGVIALYYDNTTVESSCCYSGVGIDSIADDRKTTAVAKQSCYYWDVVNNNMNSEKNGAAFALVNCVVRLLPYFSSSLCCHFQLLLLPVSKYFWDFCCGATVHFFFVFFCPKKSLLFLLCCYFKYCRNLDKCGLHTTFFFCVGLSSRFGSDRWYHRPSLWLVWFFMLLLLKLGLVLFWNDTKSVFKCQSIIMACSVCCCCCCCTR